jgi:YHS domain-containing protein
MSYGPIIRRESFTMKKDPVCGMQVDEKKAAAASTYNGERYAFCSQDCKERFDRNPDRYNQYKQSQQQQPQMR